MKILKTSILATLLAFTQLSADTSQKELAKKLANPVASLVSLPMQLNYDRGIKTANGDDGNRWTLNIQPVIPFSLNDEWNLISRTILPLVRTDNIPSGSGVNYNVGDIVQSLFFSPKAPTESGWIWGAGPALLIPSSSDISADTWGAGPTAVALKQEGPYTYGALVNHIWSMGGDVDISTTLVQPFFTYTSHTATSFSLASETTYNWEASGSQAWSVPLFFMMSQVDKIGDQTISYGAGFKYYLKSPDSGPDGWGVRFVFTLLFPK